MSRLQRLLQHLRHARMFRVLAVYAGASWIVLEVVGLFVDQIGLPYWVFIETLRNVKRNTPFNHPIIPSSIKLELTKPSHLGVGDFLFVGLGIDDRDPRSFQLADDVFVGVLVACQVFH